MKWLNKWLGERPKNSLQIKEEGVNMPQFAIIESDGTVEEGRFDNLDKAVGEATKMVKEDPETVVEVAQILKQISATIEVNVEDVK